MLNVVSRKERLDELGRNDRTKLEGVTEVENYAEEGATGK